MCGRFSLAISKERLQAEIPFVGVPDTLRTSYNIAPTQHAHIITNDQPNQLQYIAWGLVPHWSRDGKNTGRLINARREGIETKPSFRIPIRQRRCVVPADGFYEWRKDGVRKIPYRIYEKNEGLLFFAGLWDVWYNGDYGLKTFSIITTPPNFEMSGIHTRMPVLLSGKNEIKAWLNAEHLEEALAMLNTPPDGTLAMHRVSELVNSVGNDSPELHLEVPEPPTLFG